MPELKTLVNDIFKLFDPNETHEPNQENLDEFAHNIKELLRVRLSQRDKHADILRFSNLGKKDRQLWYQANGADGEEFTAKTYFKFLYGDVIEQLILFLAKEAGHTVERQQEEIEVDGVKGHIDAVIDGVTVDVKSASPYSYQKFENGKLFEDDPFGYIQQLGGYANVLTPETGGAFLAFDKVAGDICLLPLPMSMLRDLDPAKRIREIRQVLDKKTPPERCYEPEPDGKSGNMKLGTQCSYCSFKHTCWPELRTFLYANGPRFLTTVAKVPDVYEKV